MKLHPGFVLDEPKGSSLPPGFVIDAPGGEDSHSMDLSAQNRFTVNAAPMADSLTMDNVKAGASDLWSGVKRGMSSMASMPGDIAQAQFEKLFKAKNELEAGNKVQAVADLASGLTPLVPVSQNMAQQSVSQIQRAGTEAGKGDYLSAANEMAKAVPMTGPMAGQWGEDVASGHPLTAVGEAATFALAPDMAGKIPKVPGAVADGLRAASPALKEAAAIAKDAYGAKIRMYRPTAGEAALSGAAAMAGGPQAAAAVYAALKLPKVIKAVAKGIAERKSISVAKAQAEALKMSDEALLKEAQALDIAPKIDLSVEFSPENLSVYPEVVAKARELLQKGAPEEAISKSLEGHKYPQGLIDRVLKEAKAPESVPEAPKPSQETISAPDTPQEPVPAPESPKTPPVTSYRPSVSETARDVNKVISSVNRSTLARMKHVVKQAQKEGAIIWHGSPYVFDEFKLSPETIGTGEGAQAYGHGLYFAENRNVAEGYRYNKIPDYLGLKQAGLANDALKQANGNRMLALDSLNKMAIEAKLKNQPTQPIYDAMNNFDTLTKGAPNHLYKAEIPKEHIDNMLDWDKPLSEQPASVQRAFGISKESADRYRAITSEMNELQKKPGGLDSPRWNELLKEAKDIREKYPIGKSGEDAYKGLSTEGAHKASQMLKDAGIPGIKYLDAGSRGAGNGTRNFVVFDDKIIKTLERNGEKIPPKKVIQEMRAANEKTNAITDPAQLAERLSERILEMHKQGLSADQIKNALRDAHGVPRKQGAQMVNMVLAEIKKGSK